MKKVDELHSLQLDINMDLQVESLYFGFLSSKWDQVFPKILRMEDKGVWNNERKLFRKRPGLDFECRVVSCRVRPDI